MPQRDYRVVVIGGSAGSFQVVSKILHGLPGDYGLPVLLCLHRLKHVRSGFVEALMARSAIPVEEPNDKGLLRPGRAYLAPSNYHMYVELGGRFALSTEEVVNHSRPSIDLTFCSVGRVYREKAVGVLLSGANSDGAAGLAYLKRQGAYAIVQEPAESEVRTMPEAALKATSVDKVCTVASIVDFLRNVGTGKA